MSKHDWSRRSGSWLRVPHVGGQHGPQMTGKVTCRQGTPSKGYSSAAVVLVASAQHHMLWFCTLGRCSGTPSRASTAILGLFCMALHDFDRLHGHSMATALQEEANFPSMTSGVILGTWVRQPGRPGQLGCQDRGILTWDHRAKVGRRGQWWVQGCRPAG